MWLLMIISAAICTRSKWVLLVSENLRNMCSCVCVCVLCIYVCKCVTVPLCVCVCVWGRERATLSQHCHLKFNRIKSAFKGTKDFIMHKMNNSSIHTGYTAPTLQQHLHQMPLQYTQCPHHKAFSVCYSAEELYELSPLNTALWTIIWNQQ